MSAVAQRPGLSCIPIESLSGIMCHRVVLKDLTCFNNALASALFSKWSRTGCRQTYREAVGGLDGWVGIV
jgi:hypothetical protein